MIRIACHTITWGEQHFEQSLGEISDLGFGAFETFASVADNYGNRPNDFTNLLDTHGLKLISLYGGGDMHLAERRDEVIDRNVRIAEFLARHGADRMVLGPARRTDAGPTAAELSQLADTANEIGRRTRELGVLSCLHPHVYTVVESIAEIDTVMDQIDPELVGLAADTAHFAKGNADVPDAELGLFQTYADRIKYVHLKDWDPALPPDFDGDSLTPVIRDFTELGRGQVNLKGCIETLRQADYDGWLTIELDYTRSTPIESVTVSKQYLQDDLGLSIA